MIPITNQFYEMVLEISRKFKRLPAKTSILIYDSRFTPDWLIDYANEKGNKEFDDDDEFWLDGGYCYQHMMDEIDNIIDKTNEFTHICDSIDIEEDEWLCGDYIYYTGLLREGIPFCYHQPSHDWKYPSRLVLYGEEFQIEVRSDSPYIEIFEVVINVRNLFLDNSKQKVKSITKFLANTDRPLIDENFDKK